MRHALILLPVLTFGATAAHIHPAHAAPDAANDNASEASVASEEFSSGSMAENLAQVLGVQGLPSLLAESRNADDVDEGSPNARGARTGGLAPRASYSRGSHAKLPYARGSVKGQTALWTALAKSDARALTAALEAGAQVNEANRRGVTPLMAAAKAGQSDLAAILLSRGARLEDTDSQGATALFYAIDGRSQECADLLLQSAANPNALTLRGESALNRLCKALAYLKPSPINAIADASNTARRKKVVDLMVSLLCHGADPNSAPLGAPMPLAVAARNGDLGIVELLLSGGADATGGTSTPDARSGHWETPLTAVLGAGNRARLEEVFLRDGGLINESLRTDLRAEAQKNDIDIVKALLAKGAQLGEGMDRFALLEATVNSSSGGGSGDIVRLLTQNGASPLINDLERRVAFNESLGEAGARLAASNASGLSVASLVTTQFEPQLSGKAKRPTSRITRDAAPRTVVLGANTPLLASAPRLQNSRFAQALPSFGSNKTSTRARVAATPAPQLTIPVMWNGVEPVASGHLPVADETPVEVVQAVGNASVECRTDAGQLFMRLAEPEAPRFATSLLSTVSAARMSPSVGASASHALTPSGAARVQSNFDAHYGVPQGYTPLIQAARSGQVDVVKALLESGADPNVRDREGKTALMHLCGAGRASWVRQLPRRRAEALAGIRDDDPRSASRVVSYTEKRQWRTWAEDGDVAIVEALVEGGAEVNARDRDGRTPLMYAARRSSPGVVRALIASGANVNAQDRSGKTALMQIIGGGRVAAASSWVSPLLQREAQHAVSVAKGGNLVLQQKAIDAEMRYELHRDLVTQEAQRDDDIILVELRRARANTGLRDISGRTALDLALAAGQQNAVRWLMGDVY